ncbi:MAG: hypothetical protein WC323_04715 [Patescibacteria group bacterium]|jgi:antitoxin component of MazEF toxin-antitoxin module
MPGKKVGYSNIRKLTKSGGGRSFSLTLPIKLVRELKWNEGLDVIASIKGKSLVIESWGR